MDLVFGDTDAHEEQTRLRQVEAQLRGVQIDGTDPEKEAMATTWSHNEV